MTNKKNNKKDKEKIFEYNILGDAFMGALFNMDEDNSSQNLTISMESDKIQQAIRNSKQK